uniref:Uncharacterized protein n=1 Tax=Fusarium oxysporum (strain Fo5176) TaxID=660025 RepID=A0A0D2XQ20_FUSOF
MILKASFRTVSARFVLALLRDELNLKMSLTMLQDLDLRDA